MNSCEENITVDLDPDDVKIKKELNVSIERKCGEIYFTNHMFYLSCNYCGSKFNTIKLYVQHFIHNHLSLSVDQTILVIRQILSDDEDSEAWDENNDKLNFELEGETTQEDFRSDELDTSREDVLKNNSEFYENNGDERNTNDVEEKKNKASNKVKNSKRKTDVNQIIGSDFPDDNERKKWICSVCNTPFTRRDNMLRHKWKIHKEKPNPDYGEIRLDCKWCGQHFKRHSDRSRHENQQHDADGAKINRRRNYKENPLERHVCETCGNSYKHAWSLQEHLRIHTGERPFVCDLCNATFAKRQNFIVHMKYHSNERRFKCQYCDKGFVQKTKLILHEMVHTGTYKAQCTICGKQFRCRSRLNVHMKRHIYDKCHKCDQCEKRFYTADSLKRHTAIHSDKKPFRCEICFAEYFTKCSLQKHTKRRHKASQPPDLPIANTENPMN
ncbi:zinc finger protein 616-like [Condylostylus longicornis]|uniref:zinc finger protein 616-like n=1 Tax=Condylostylus longicornis TaxID=2530218 RepID=UPI00244E26A5|nr:zinc finger protein 616-like [Condylostylus longicornis]